MKRTIMLMGFFFGAITVAMISQCSPAYAGTYEVDLRDALCPPDGECLTAYVHFSAEATPTHDPGVIYRAELIDKSQQMMFWSGNFIVDGEGNLVQDPNGEPLKLLPDISGNGSVALRAWIPASIGILLITWNASHPEYIGLEAQPSYAELQLGKPLAPCLPLAGVKVEKYEMWARGASSGPLNGPNDQ